MTRTASRPLLHTAAPPTFAELSEMPDDRFIPRLDRKHVDERRLNPMALQWRREGVVLLEKFLPDDLIHAYCEVRGKLQNPGGWACPTPYMYVPEIIDLCCYKPLADVLYRLIGQEMGLHLNLTGWVSTERSWHQDDYLNPPFVNSWYAAVWMALDDIHPDSGPFEYVPGSHRWPIVRGHRVRSYLGPEDAKPLNWALASEAFVERAYADEIERTQLPVRPFLGKRGDVLVWHGRLAHRGSRPNKRGMQRRGLIAHYSGIHARQDLRPLRRTAAGVPYFFLLGWPLDAKAPTANDPL